LQEPNFAREPVTPTSPCPIQAGKLVVEALDSTEDLQPTERDMEQMLDMCRNPLYPQAMNGRE